MCGLFAGVVVAASAFPSLAVVGLTAKASSDGFEGLPTELQDPPAPQTSWLYANDGETLITSFYDESRKEVDLDDIAPVMQKAIIAAEDNRFYEHNGVDLVGVIRAGVANQGGGEVSQGASTLTMQYVRQALTYNAKTNQDVLEATEDTPQRKLREMRYAAAVEKQYSKKEILERYLNLVFLGNQSYGVYAASQAYFSKDPSELELQEAAMLAALPKAPGTIDPSLGEKENKKAKERRNYVLDRMVKTKAISKKQADKAKKTDLDLKPSNQPSDCTAVPQDRKDWGFFCDFFKDWWMNNPQFGSTKDERLNNLKTGGYVIKTTLDPDLQEKAQKEVTKRQKKDSSWALGDVTLDPKTGSVKSMAINRDFSLDISKNGPNSGGSGKGTYPATTVPLLSGGSGKAGAGFQAGSTFKMFTMLAALKQGKSLKTTYDNPKGDYPSKIYGVGYNPTESSCGKRNADGQYAWCPGNDNPKWMAGKADMYRGFGRSVNTYFVQLLEDVGAENAVDMAKSLGIDLRGKGDQENDENPRKKHLWGSFTLGVSDTTVMDVAEAYGTVANDGIHCDPLPVKSMTDSKGNKVDAKPECERVISSDVARAAADAARCPVGDQAQSGKCQDGTFRDGHKIVGRPMAGKTGTTQSNQASWFVGMTPNIVSAGFIADPDVRSKSLPQSYHNLPHEAVSHTMKAALEGEPVENFKKPTGKLVG
ncbi:transglycosylase domain-containing protein [Stackebrandtia nassauensis]|uniref:Peptidoglycan glycosyltransferase n=1 Tax=Stackebrandtia nassauensis (strain DSM 44728 / CIP 108903 / NRRL B-16338 / NBRC 102104 / LLR-40K-21) TaxID=446470 RepID=D3QA54_STANL|nr:transglycosylase domain-containing protein [Stackebrandtia nassauensis]ADD40766.1 Peptidoglycan glycosyltransferase [Stackebrandtia nassauensis DSM 44728]